MSAANVAELVEALSIVLCPALTGAADSEAPTGYADAIAAADPGDNPLGLVTLYRDWVAEIVGDEMPALVIVPFTFDEERDGGGQGNGSKALYFDIAIVVHELGDLSDPYTTAVAHRARMESVMTRLREASFAALGCNQWAGAMRMDRQPPARDDEALVYTSQVTIHRMALYLDG